VTRRRLAAAYSVIKVNRSINAAEAATGASTPVSVGPWMFSGTDCASRFEVQGASSRATTPGRRGRRPAFPLQPRHGYAAGFHHGLPALSTHRQGVARSAAGRALLTGPHPPGSSRRNHLRGFHHWFLRSYAFRLACRTQAVWQCRPVPSLERLLPPSPSSPGSGCLRLQQAAATAAGGFSHPPDRTAPRGAKYCRPRVLSFGIGCVCQPRVSRSDRSLREDPPSVAGVPAATATPEGDGCGRYWRRPSARARHALCHRITYRPVAL
jgi:hypothetical protein